MPQALTARAAGASLNASLCTGSVVAVLNQAGYCTGGADIWSKAAIMLAADLTYEQIGRWRIVENASPRALLAQFPIFRLPEVRWHRWHPDAAARAWQSPKDGGKPVDVAAATLMNSVLLQLFSHFVDLLAGLWFTQANDALWVGMRSIEPPGVFPWFEIGAALFIDALIALALLKLARKVSKSSRTAAMISLCIYLIDCAAFGYDFRASVRSHVSIVFLVWQALTILVHVAGVLILYRAWMMLHGRSRPLAPAAT